MILALPQLPWSQAFDNSLLIPADIIGALSR
jgi:hypothetical protein